MSNMFERFMERGMQSGRGDGAYVTGIAREIIKRNIASRARALSGSAGE